MYIYPPSPLICLFLLDVTSGAAPVVTGPGPHSWQRCQMPAGQGPSFCSRWSGGSGSLEQGPEVRLAAHALSGPWPSQAVQVPVMSSGSGPERTQCCSVGGAVTATCLLPGVLAVSLGHRLTSVHLVPAQSVKGLQVCPHPPGTSLTLIVEMCFYLSKRLGRCTMKYS